MTAYTIGNRESYDQLDFDDKVFKIGRRDNYPGGIVWSGVDAIIVAMRLEHTEVPSWPIGVYSLELPGKWEEATHVVDGEAYLIHDAVLLGKVAEINRDATGQLNLVMV